MKKLLGTSLFILFLFSSSALFAQEEQKVREISFEEDLIEGDLMMPDSSNIRIKEMDELSSLIKAREDFVEEMLKSVDEL